MVKLLLLYLFLINALGLLLMLADKAKARKNLWRIPERTLMTVAALGGSLGCLIGMYTAGALDVFLEEMSGILPDAALLKKRLRVLLNLHRIKWSCILLNELLPSRARNRVFSGTDGIPVPNLLARARKYYENPLSRRHDSDPGDSGRVQRIAGEESVS